MTTSPRSMPEPFASLKFDAVGTWECDTCGHRGTEREIIEHGVLDGCGSGALLVGGLAYEARREFGTHPMTILTEMVEEELLKTGLIVEVLRDDA